MGEDGGLFAVGEVRNNEAIAGKRLKIEDVGTGLYVRYERIGVCVEIGAAYNKTLCAQLANHVAAAGAGLEDRAFDLDRTAERRDNPARVDSEVLVPVEAFKAARRDVATIAGVANVSAGINKSIHVQAPVAPPKEPKQRERPGTPPDRRQDSSQNGSSKPSGKSMFQMTWPFALTVNEGLAFGCFRSFSRTSSGKSPK